MSFPQYLGKAAGSAAVIAQVEALLARAWDPNGELVSAARLSDSRDHGRPRTLAEFAAAVCGILGAGGSEAEVSGYLRREEAALWELPRTQGTERAAIAGAAWRIVRGISRPEDLDASPDVLRS